MKRRKFITNSLLAGAGMISVASMAKTASGISENSEAGELTKTSKFQFNLKYAPHDGMFVNHAGKDIIDQIKFMADTGFTAFEDNGMMGRPVEQQEKIGNELARHGQE